MRDHNNFTPRFGVGETVRHLCGSVGVVQAVGNHYDGTCKYTILWEDGGMSSQTYHSLISPSPDEIFKEMLNK